MEVPKEMSDAPTPWPWFKGEMVRAMRHTCLAGVGAGDGRGRCGEVLEGWDRCVFTKVMERLVVAFKRSMGFISGVCAARSE